MIVAPERGLRLLTILEERVELIRKLGINKILPIHFDRQIQRLSGEEFVRKFLVNRFKAQRVCVGFDYAFGKGRTGHIGKLKRLSEIYGFKVSVISPVAVDSLIVKSSTIRKLLSFGHLEKANRFLGYSYLITGKVIKGSGRGKSLGFHTANLKVPRHKLLPAHGVYAGKAVLRRRKYHCLINIGARPTFGGQVVAVETHILNFKKDILGQKIRLELMKRLRAEKQFSDVLDLTRQIKKDIARARRLW